jgi:hypothetical protein
MGGEANGFKGIPANHFIVRLRRTRDQYSNTPLLQHSISLLLRLLRLLNHLPKCNMFS